MQLTRKHFSRMRTAPLPNDPGLMSGGGGWVCIPTPWYTHPVPLRSPGILTPPFPWYTPQRGPWTKHTQVPEGIWDQAYSPPGRDMGPGMQHPSPPPTTHWTLPSRNFCCGR